MKAAALVAQTYVQETLRLLNEARSQPELAPLLDQVTAGMVGGRAFSVADRHRAVARHSEYGAHMLMLIAQTAAVARNWQRHKVVYRLHPALADELLHTDHSTKVPCEVFRRLPHPDPFLALPVPLEIPSPKGAEPVSEPSHLVGLLATGVTSRHTLCSSADPEAVALQLQLATRVHYVGQDASYEEITLQLPLSGQATVDDLARRYLRDVTQGPRWEQQVLDGMRLSVGLLLYLVSDRADVQPAAGAGPSRRGRREQPVQVVDVGYDVGPALLTARRQPTTDASATTATGMPVRAHLRRAHWHTHWTGPREQQQAVLRWLHPILVHPDSGSPTRPTVVDTRR